MIYVIAAIISYLSAATPQTTIKEYAKIIAFESRWYSVDPRLVGSIIQIESGWNPNLKSTTNDYGLMQVHVAKNGSANFWGREKELYDVRTNIREGIRILAMWRTYHNKWCRGNHHYWAHYKWGRVVKNTDHADRVYKLYMHLKKKFIKVRLPRQPEV